MTPTKILPPIAMTLSQYMALQAEVLADLQSQQSWRPLVYEALSMAKASLAQSAPASFANLQAKGIVA